MKWIIEYYNEGVKKEIENIPISIKASYFCQCLIKKTQKTPNREILLARKRLQEVKNVQ